MYVYVCIRVHTLNITESLCCIPEANTLTMLYLKKKKANRSLFFYEFM